MESLIEQFLFRYSYCPLPGIGTLSIVARSANADWGHKVIQPPAQLIEFQHADVYPAQAFLQYIARQRKVSITTAEKTLSDFCNTMNTLDSLKQISIVGVGQFSKDESGRLQLQAVTCPASYLPVVQFERVAHPDSVHTIRVGDNERSSDFMNSYFAGLKNIHSSHWQLAAWVMLLLALGVCFYYYFFIGTGTGSLWPIEPATEPATYQLIQP